MPKRKLTIFIIEQQGGLTLLAYLYQPLTCLGFFVLLFLVFDIKYQ